MNIFHNNENVNGQDASEIQGAFVGLSEINDLNNFSNSNDSKNNKIRFTFTSSRLQLLLKTAIDKKFFTEYWDRDQYYELKKNILEECISKDEAFTKCTASKVEEKFGGCLFVWNACLVVCC